MRARRVVLAGLIAILMMAAPVVAAKGEAARTRPGGHGSGSAGVARGSAQRPGGGAVRATGRATYGHFGGFRRGYRYYPYYGYYEPYFAFGYYGWPWWGWYGYYAPYYPYGIGVYDAAPQGPAQVETDIRPKKASVSLDGEDVGFAKDYNGRWDRLWVEPGRHEIVFERDGYRTLRVAFRARPGRAYRFAYDLQRGAGLDPRSVAGVDEGEPAHAGPAESVERPPAPESPAAERPNESLPRGFLRLRVEPPDAAVYLDGEFLGSGAELARLHGALPVAAGEHRVEVARPGYEGRSVPVIVEAGDSSSLDIVLQRGDGASESGEAPGR
jgi:hypothetical protein